METEKTLLSQKEYLKRYLSKDKNKKKKKQNKISSSSHVKRSVIIDDDLGLRDVATVDDEEFNLDYLGDEAPQIAGIVDERPDELKAKERYSNNLWSSVDRDGNTDNDSKQCGKSTSVVPKTNPPNCGYDDASDSDLSLPRPEKRAVDEYKVNDSRNSKDECKKKLQKKNSKDKVSSDSDLSPDRRSVIHGHSDSDLSPPRSSKYRKYDKETDSYGMKHKNSHSTRNYSVYSPIHEKIEKKIKDKRAKHKDEDSESDSTLKVGTSRDKHKHYVEKENRKMREDVRSRHKSFSGNEAVDSYRHRNNEKYQNHRGSKSNSSRKYSELDSKKKIETSSAKIRSVKNRDDSDSDLSPARNNSQPQKKKAKSHSRHTAEERMLDGKKSGLQDAKHLKEELKRLKENEDKLFRKMDPSLLGANAAPIKRDRKTGQVRQIEKEREEEKVIAEKRAKTENKYYKWGKGLKQMQDQEERVADALHEMSKPLARYRDDKDLDAFLRAQEREGDPMLDYIKSKQAESHNVIDLSVGGTKPRYNGSFMPNRFGIVPGYRWDGVDRSNGYEKKWFEQKNARKAVEEEAYKWSTSDM